MEWRAYADMSSYSVWIGIPERDLIHHSDWEAAESDQEYQDLYFKRDIRALDLIIAEATRRRDELMMRLADEG